MANILNNDHDELVKSLASGFESLLEEFQLLALRNARLEQRLADAQKQVCVFSPSQQLYISHEETQ